MSHLHPNRGDDDQIFQKYLDRAISDVNELQAAIAGCDLCTHDRDFRPVLGTGHPLADVFLVKFKPRSDELDEGVAFYGRAGEAIMASMARLGVDPLDLYGTNCVKCAEHPSECMRERCPTWLAREILIVSPKMIVVMGRKALEIVNEIASDDAARLIADPGQIQQWTHTCEALWCPDIDESLDGPVAKQAFWDAFRPLGDWYAAKPPW